MFSVWYFTVSFSWQHNYDVESSLDLYWYATCGMICLSAGFQELFAISQKRSKDNLLAACQFIQVRAALWQMSILAITYVSCSGDLFASSALFFFLKNWTKYFIWLTQGSYTSMCMYNWLIKLPLLFSSPSVFPSRHGRKWGMAAITSRAASLWRWPDLAA